MNKIKISVRNLIELVLRSGDIDNSFMSTARALEGTLAHQKVQKSYGDEYKSEYTLKHSFQYEDFALEVEGRADGIFLLENKVVIDEIKSTTRKLDDIEEDYNHLHWAQAKSYAYIYALQNNLANIDIQLTYFQLESEEIKIFERNFTFIELEKFFIRIIESYIKWANITFTWSEIRDSSIKDLQFPFQNYRKGQREFAVAVYKTIVEGKKLFAQAPTGIGKTMSTLFPSLKAMGEGATSKIFYLTAKTITREVPISSMDLMLGRDLRAKTLVITAKDKICLNEEVKCNPRDCSYAKGHYDRVNDAIMDIFENEDMINRDTVIRYSKKHHVCPFEFSLDISLWSDVIICDYNYAFDPQVYLRRFFEGAREDYVFLVDEAHNLVDRSREMFSAHINKADFLDLREIFLGKYPKIYKGFKNINAIINKKLKELNIVGNYYRREEIEELYYPIRNLISSMEIWLIEEKEHVEYDRVIEFYFAISSFIKIWDFYDQHYVTSFEKDGSDLVIKLYCVNSAYLLREAEQRAKASIFFSATLTPLDYHMDLLGGSKEDYHIKLTSPFPRENLRLLVHHGVSTRYRDRKGTYMDIVESITTTVDIKKGNYLVFFPSYIYMKNIYDLMVDKRPDLNIVLQEGKMGEEAREGFLANFTRENNLIAFAVMGGIFSEGIDLVGDRLIGAIVIGVGLPQICFERDIIRDYFDHELEGGFDYAYIYPGMNKVLQAAGRVIRTETDRGIVLLIDDRFTSFKYRELFPREWANYKRVSGTFALKKSLGDFWG